MKSVSLLGHPDPNQPGALFFISDAVAAQSIELQKKRSQMQSFNKN
jgi:hypothetical protein